MTTCRTNCQQARSNLKHNKRAQGTKSKGLQSFSLASQGTGMVKGDDIACLLRIKLRAMLSWRAELIRVPSHPPEGLMLLLFIFFPKVASAGVPCGAQGICPTPVLLTTQKTTHLCFGQVTNHARPSTNGLKGRTCLLYMYHSWAFRLRFQPNTLSGRRRDLHDLTNSPR